MADVNGDGLPDFIYDTPIQGGTEIHVLLNNGNGTFGPDTVWWTRTSTTPFKMADVNGDGMADLVYADTSGYINVMVSLGNAFFIPRPFGGGSASRAPPSILWT